MEYGGHVADDFNDSVSQTLPAEFPKGHDAFYIMKTEVSQGQYVNFLNTLCAGQVDVSYPNASGAARHTISGAYTNYSATAPHRACNYLTWLRSAAYADWAGLRPITELEYEKACRGPNSAVANEYAWGSASVHGSAYTIADDGEANATVSNPGSGTGNASWANTDGSINGPLRCGIFSASTVGATRAEAGGTYYGVMEMSGNLWEAGIVSVGRAGGRSFTGTHGDGMLTSDGYADNSDWPGYTGGKVSDEYGGGAGVGICARGGHWYRAADYMRVSTRYNINYKYGDWRPWYGWRGGRTAP